MADGVVDTTVIVHYLRKNPAARAWMTTRTSPLLITPISWLEVMRGAPGKDGQIAAKAVLQLFEMAYLTQEDMNWAMFQMETYRLSRGLEINDTLIASVCHRLGLPIYTDNEKDYLKLLPRDQVIKPYG
jgi:hypothetical protein